MHIEGVQIEIAYTLPDGSTDGFILTLHAGEGGVAEDATYVFQANKTSINVGETGASESINIASYKVSSSNVISKRGVQYSLPS